MIIKRGNYKSINPDISYYINDDLHLFADEHIYFLDGNNGIGKTTFIEQIVLPLLKKQKLPALFVGQDYELQLYLMCATSLCPVHIALENPSNLLQSLLRKYNYIKIIIFDEFDKRCEIKNLNNVLDKHNISSILVITHIPSHHRKDYFSETFKTGCTLHMNNNNSTEVCNNRVIELSCEILWQQ